MSEEIDGDPIAHEDAIGRLLNSLRSGGPAALGLARSHLPGLGEASNTTLRARGFDLSDAELAHARHYGFESWAQLRSELFRAGLDPDQAGGPFVRAADAIHAGDRRRLQRVLRDDPEMVEAGAGGDLDPLLYLAVACREVELVELLLEAGSDPLEPARSGFTPLHRAAYGHPPEARPSAQRDFAAILDRLLAHEAVGQAALEHACYGEGGTPLAMALFWGHRALAEKLVAAGAQAFNLRLAAGMGDVDRCSQFFDGKQLKPAAGRGREFYRPHDGFPEWSPSDRQEEILDEAFVWAAKSGRHAALELLLDKGARIDACPYDAPALAHVAGSGPLETVRWLLEHGANPRQAGGYPRGATALHLAAAQGHLEAVRLLVRKGADKRQEDDEFGADAAGYAEWGGHPDIIDFLSSPPKKG